MGRRLKLRVHEREGLQLVQRLVAEDKMRMVGFAVNNLLRDLDWERLAAPVGSAGLRIYVSPLATHGWALADGDGKILVTQPSYQLLSQALAGERRRLGLRAMSAGIHPLAPLWEGEVDEDLAWVERIG